MADPEGVEPPGQIPRCRPFNLGDAMILVAAAAVVLANARGLWDRYGGVVVFGDGSIVYLGVSGSTMITLLVKLVHLLALAMTLAFWLIRLRGPRPGLATLAHQLIPPTVVATIAVALIGLDPKKGWSDRPPIEAICGAILLGATPGIWTALRPKEVGWIGRLGTGLVMLWAVDGLLSYACATLIWGNFPGYWVWDYWLARQLGLA